MSKHVWAPEMHFLFGKWYVYFAAGEKDDIWKIRPYVLECQGPDPMKDAWVELGKMQRADEDGVTITFGRRKRVWAGRFPTFTLPKWRARTS